MRVAAVAFFALMCALPAVAQYAERLDVWVANIDVVVTDRDGNPVKGLTKDDFEILENGKKQTITNFSAFEEVPPPPAEGEATAVAPAPPSRPRLIVMFVDIDDIEPAMRQRFFSGVREFLDTALRPGDFLTVLTWNRRLRVALAPTSERVKVDAVLKALSLPYGRRDEAMAAALTELKAEQAARDAALARELGIGLAADSEAEAAFQEWQLGEETCSEMKRKPRELRNMLAMFSRVEMQKVLVFSSDNASLTISPGSRRLPAGCLPRAEWEALGDAANAYGITIHAFHPPGIRDPMAAQRRTMTGSSIGAGEYQRTFEESGGLIELAARTGGITGVGPAQSATKLVQVARELDVYYSIGYSMTPGNEDRPRNLKVVTKNKKYDVRSRRSIVRPSEETRVRDTVVTNLYLAPADAPEPLAFSARIVKFTPDGRFRLAHVEVRVAASELALLDTDGGKRRGSFSIFVAAGREFGDASEVSEMKQDFELPEGANDLPIVYSFASRIRPDTQRLSIALRDNTTGEVAANVITLGLE